MTVTAVGRTHVGLVRQRNEDRVYVGESLFAVADGLGGHPAGDIASATVIDALQSHDCAVEPADAPVALGRAVSACNQALRRRIETEPQLAGMGSTLVALLWSGPTAVLANVGDSRAYLLRQSDSATVRLTEDHTYEHLVADANIVPNLPERMTRWLDGRPDGRSPDLMTLDLRSGDRLLLCSDGLSSFVSHDLIDAALSAPSEPGDAADRLITLAIDHGGPDNVSAIVIDVRD
jgi:serine/threonine protein phosphatase PrpC